MFLFIYCIRVPSALQHVQNFQERDPLMNLASTAQLVIVMFSFFFSYIQLEHFKCSEAAIRDTLTLGISQRQLKRLLFTENMIIGILSIFIGIQGGLVFSNFFLLVTSKLTSAKGLYLYWPTEAIIVTTVTFIILFLIVSTFTPMFIRTRKTVHLIKGTKVTAEKGRLYSSLYLL